MISLFVSTAVFICTGAAFVGLGSVILPGDLLSRRIAAGVICLHIILSIAGWLGFYHDAVMWGILACCIMLFILRFRTWNPPGGILWLVGGLLLLLPLTVLPPFSRDAMNHHLYLPRLWLYFGGIVRPGWTAFFSSPYMVETLYALTGGTFGFAGARMISLLGFAATGIALLELKGGKKIAGMLPIIVLFSIPELLRNATWAFSDTFLVFFSLMAFLEMVRDEGRPLAAVAWAAAASMCKYNGFLVLAATLFLLPARFRISWRTMAVMLGLTLFLVGWWAVPNLVQWGNPVYPLMRGIFGPADSLSAGGRELLNAAGAYSSGTGSIPDFVLLPIRISISGQWDNPRLFDGASGPLLLAGVLLFMLIGRSRKRYLVLPTLYLLSALLFTEKAIRIRYFLPGLVMLTVPAALGLQALARRSKLIVTVLLVCVCMIWTGMKVVELYVQNKPWKLTVDSEYLANRLEYIPFYREAETVLDIRDVTLFVNMGNRAFYFPSYVIFDAHRYPLTLLEGLWSGMTSGEIAEELKSRGIEYLAMHMGYTSINIPFELSDREMAVWREFVTMRLKPVISRNPYVLFELI